ncbi:MAG: PEP-CTERM sorting domain-containing protein [Gammaproteobacteria bacterium]|nr:MAG: PEP-CTERM sorting domain-containing protein [Gammaproteobacteria bacterium]
MGFVWRLVLLKTLYSLTAIVCLFAATLAQATVIGVTVDGVSSMTAVGETENRAALGGALAVKYYIPLTDTSDCVYGVSCGTSSDSGSGGTLMSMFLMFDPISTPAGYTLEILFEDLDLIDVNDPVGFLETLQVWNSVGISLTGLITDIASSYVVGNHLTQQLLTLNLGPIVSSPLWLELTFSASYVHRGWNTPEFLIATVSSVPEPATLSLLGAGLLGLVFIRRKRAQSTTI